MGSDKVGATPHVDRDAILIPGDWTQTLDVLFDDQRIFALAPDRHRVRADGRRSFQWPQALRTYLRGSTRVTLREHVSRQTLFAQEVIFDNTSSRIQVVDDEGVALALDKWGSLNRTFEAGGRQIELLLEDLRELLRVLNDEIGMDAFIAYGTLLGAVRGGSLISHDTDADISYYSRFQHPADIIRESYALQRRLVEKGWRVRRRTGAFVQVFRDDDASTQRKIDIFTSYHVNGWLAVNMAVRARLPRESVLPLREVELEGVPLPAPQDPEALLAATYGESWRVPDPAFKFTEQPATRQRAEGWFFHVRTGNHLWRKTFAKRPPATGRSPSPFARFVADRLPAGGVLADVGCGPGNDALWFASNGHHVIGFDYLPGLLKRADRRARRLGIPASFELASLYQLRLVIAKGALLAAHPEPSLYVRNVLEAVHPAGRQNLWLMAKAALGGGGSLFVEFRTSRAADGSEQTVRSPLLRTFDPETLVAEIEARGGSVEERSLVTYKNGQSCRLAVRWPPAAVRPPAFVRERAASAPPTASAHGVVDAEHEHRDYWERFYSGDASKAVPREPSPFAQWVAGREDRPGPLVDVGAGTGRDALWFASQGFRTLGLDYVAGAMRLASSLADSEGLPASFEELNLYHDQEVQAAGDRIAGEHRPRVVYARFFVHALEDDGRQNLWRLTHTLLREGGTAYFEFRVAETRHEFGEHYRRFVGSDVVATEVERNGGRVDHNEVGYGLAVYKNEDPLVCRIVATWT